MWRIWRLSIASLQFFYKFKIVLQNITSMDDKCCENKVKQRMGRKKLGREEFFGRDCKGLQYE